MPLAKPLNYARSTLAANYTAGSGTLVLKAGAGDLFGEPSVDAPIRITVARRGTLEGGLIAAGTIKTTYLCTSRTGDTLSGLAADTSYADQDFDRNDPVEATISAETIEEIQAAAAAGPVDAVRTTGEYDDPPWLVGVATEKIAPAPSGTTFNPDGSIVQTYGSGLVVTTTFNPDGSITEVSGPPVNKTKTTVFNPDGSITETVE